MIIDTHCHYNLEPIFRANRAGQASSSAGATWKDHWQEAQAAGVYSSLVVGTTPQTSALAIEIANQEQKLFASIGVHPYQVAELGFEESKFDEYLENIGLTFEKLAHEDQGKKIIAIGEIGLDYYRLKNLEKNAQERIIDQQKILFSNQLNLALKLNLPVILHTRDTTLPENPTRNNAYWDTLEILKSHKIANSIAFVLHCVSGPASYVETAIDMGGYIGVAGNVTYPSADQIRNLVKIAPKEKILLETDSPYLPPQQFRGKTCLPKMIAHTAEYLEQELGLPKQQLLDNTKRIMPKLAN